MRVASWLLGAAVLVGLVGAQAQAADAKAGRKVFQQCLQCHHIGLGATNFYGPVLNGLIGRKAGSVPGYLYSDAMVKSGIVWDHDSLVKYLRSPRHEVPGVAMTFAGLQNDADIENVIAYVSKFRRDGGHN